MTQPNNTPLDPAQQTFYAEIKPLVDCGLVSEEDLNIATSVLNTTDRNPDERAAVSRVWKVYVGIRQLNSQNANKEAS